MKKIGNLRLNAMQKLTPEEQRQILGGVEPHTCSGWAENRVHWHYEIIDWAKCGCEWAGEMHIDRGWEMEDFVGEGTRMAGTPYERIVYFRAHKATLYERKNIGNGHRVKRRGKWEWDHFPDDWKKATYQFPQDIQVGPDCSTWSKAKNG